MAEVDGRSAGSDAAGAGNGRRLARDVHRALVRADPDGWAEYFVRPGVVDARESAIFCGAEAASSARDSIRAAADDRFGVAESRSLRPLRRPTYRKIARAKWAPKFAVPLNVGQRLISKGFARAELISELDWWEGAQVTDDVRVTAVPALHFSGRGLRDRNRTLWAGYVVEGPSGKVFFAGTRRTGRILRRSGRDFRGFGWR